MRYPRPQQVTGIPYKQPVERILVIVAACKPPIILKMEDSAVEPRDVLNQCGSLLPLQRKPLRSVQADLSGLIGLRNAVDSPLMLEQVWMRHVNGQLNCQAWFGRAHAICKLDPDYPSFVNTVVKILTKDVGLIVFDNREWVRKKPAFARR